MSRHCPDDFPCSEVSVHSWASRKIDQSLGCGFKKTLIKCLWFHSNLKKIPIYVIVRKKEPVAKVLKLLRKGEKNPDIAVTDELGLMGVLDNITDSSDRVQDVDHPDRQSIGTTEYPWAW